MFKLLLILFLYVQICTVKAVAQDADSTLDALQHIPTRYINTIDSKIDKYSSRITTKTTKTLTKLSRWENKIKSLLEKASPQTAAQLFAPGQPTFTSLLQQIQQGEAIALSYQAQYNKYTDDITTSLNYIAQQKEQLDSGFIKKATAAHQKMKALAYEEDKSEALQQFIKERKKQLISQAVTHIGQSKYLVKMNKEAFYYAETLKNYKEIFSDSKKAEETVKGILNRIPAFSEFVKKNSMIAGLFNIPDGTAQLLPGIQTRAGVQSEITQRLTAMGGNAQELMTKNLQAAEAKLNKLKSKMNENNNSGEDVDFKIKDQKSKTFGQRLEYIMNIQFAKSNGFVSSASNIALGIGYKLGNTATVGGGISYKLGMGNINNIHFTHEGIGLRSFLDWKLPPLYKKMKNLFSVTGGFEMNYNQHFKDLAFLKNNNVWQRSALLGVTKKMSVKTKWFKGSNVQLLVDLLAKQHIPVSQMMVFRIGYSF